MTWRPPAHALRAWRRNRPIPGFNQLDLLSAGHPQDGFQQTGHMAFMIGVCAGMHPECVHCTVRQLEQAQAEGPATPDVSPSDAYRRTHAKERRLDGKNQRNV